MFSTQLLTLNYLLVLRRTVVACSDWRLNNLRGWHHHSNHDFRSGCWNVSYYYPQQFFTELQPPERSDYTIKVSPAFKLFTVLYSNLYKAVTLSVGRFRQKLCPRVYLHFWLFLFTVCRCYFVFDPVCCWVCWTHWGEFHSRYSVIVTKTTVPFLRFSNSAADGWYVWMRFILV